VKDTKVCCPNFEDSVEYLRGVMGILETLSTSERNISNPEKHVHERRSCSII
jgi:hypothetical protein